MCLNVCMHVLPVRQSNPHASGMASAECYTRSPIAWETKFEAELQLYSQRLKFGLRLHENQGLNIEPLN